jgi:hypothetical protein
VPVLQDRVDVALGEALLQGEVLEAEVPRLGETLVRDEEEAP